MYWNKNIKLLLPLWGMGFFVVFYVLASLNYPGGSRTDPDAVGFSFWDNYLCDLLDIQTLNGEFNPGRTFTLAALFMLCVGLMVLWLHLPKLFNTNVGNNHLVRATGILALVLTMAMPLGNHDIMVRVAGVAGLIALILVMYGLFKSGQTFLVRFGTLCLVVFLANYLIYETGAYLEALPVIQKFTFVFFMAWFAWMNLTLYQQEKSR